MQNTRVNLVGNLTMDPVHKVSANQQQRYTRFRMACPSRTFNKALNQWVDGPTSFYSVVCYRELGVNVAESLHKGQQVLVIGDLTIREYQTVDPQGGESTRISADVVADAVGHSLNFGTSRFMKTDRSADVDARAVGESAADPYLTTQSEPDAEDVEEELPKAS